MGRGRMELTEFERMARGISSRWFLLVTLDLRAYVDDSETGGISSVLAGYSAPYDEWMSFNAEWHKALEYFHLEEFKAHDLEQGKKQFKGRKDRPEIRECFVSLICK